eukprot:2530668-Rhodomonas_salina.1
MSRSVHEEIASGKVEADVSEWFSDVPGLMVRTTDEGDSDGTLFGNLGSTRGGGDLNFATGVSALSRSDSAMLADLVVSLGAWGPHTHDLQQLDALTQYLAGGLAAVLAAGLVHLSH